MVRLGLVGGGWLLGPGGLRESTDHSDLTFFCGGDGVRVHGLSALLVPLLPVVEEAKLVQAGEQRIYITLEGADSKALVNLLTLLYTGTLEVEEVDRQALLEMSKMLKVSNKISGLKTLNDNTRSNVAKEIEATAEAETGEASETDSSKKSCEAFEADNQKLSGKAQLVEKTRRAREAKKAGRDDGVLVVEANTSGQAAELKEEELVDKRILQEIGRLEKALKEVYPETDEKICEESEPVIFAEDEGTVDKNVEISSHQEETDRDVEDDETEEQGKAIQKTTQYEDRGEQSEIEGFSSKPSLEAPLKGTDEDCEKTIDLKEPPVEAAETVVGQNSVNDCSQEDKEETRVEEQSAELAFQASHQDNNDEFTKSENELIEEPVDSTEQSSEVLQNQNSQEFNRTVGGKRDKRKDLAEEYGSRLERVKRMIKDRSEQQMKFDLLSKKARTKEAEAARQTEKDFSQISKTTPKTADNEDPREATATSTASGKDTCTDEGEGSDKEEALESKDEKVSEKVVTMGETGQGPLDIVERGQSFSELTYGRIKQTEQAKNNPAAIQSDGKRGNSCTRVEENTSEGGNTAREETDESSADQISLVAQNEGESQSEQVVPVKDTAQFQKDITEGSKNVYKRKLAIEESANGDGKKKKTTKLHCKCMTPTSGGEVQCILCLERYHINCLNNPPDNLICHWTCPPCTAEKRREERRKEEDLCREIEEAMRKKRRKKRKALLHLPESACNIHPPLPLGSKHFSLDLPRLPKGSLPRLPKGKCSQLGFQTEKQMRRMRKRERRERRRRKREEKIKSSSESKTEDEEDLKCLRSRGDESSTDFDETDFLPPRPPTPEKKLKKGFGWVLEYVPFEKKVADNKSRKMPPIKKDLAAGVKPAEITSTSSSEGSKNYGTPGTKTSANLPPPKMAEKEDPDSKVVVDTSSNVRSTLPQCNFSLKCEVCDVEVKTLSALYSHYASHFSAKVEKSQAALMENFRCLVCGQSFKSRQILTHHIGIRHGKINDTLAKEGLKVLPCPVYIVEGKMQKEMQKNLMAMQKNLMTIKEEKVEETPYSTFEEAAQAEEGSGRLYVEDNGPRFKNPDHDGSHFEAEYSWNETNAGLTTLAKEAEGGNQEGNSSSFLNQPRGTSDKENNKIATANPGIITKQPQGPKIVLSKSCTPKHSKEKTDEARYGVQTFIEGGDLSNTKSRMDVRSSNRPDLPPLKIRASFSETLQEVEFSERRRKKKKAKRTKNEEDTAGHRVSSTTSELGRHHFRPSDSDTSVSKTREEFSVSQKIFDEDENTSNRTKTKDFTTLHFCYECKSIFISKEGLKNHKKSECV